MAGSSGGRPPRVAKVGAESRAKGPKPATDPPLTDVAATERRRRVVRAGHMGDVATAASMLDDGDPSVRASALGALARTGALDVPGLIAMLRDPDPGVRRRTCDEAGRVAASGTGEPARRRRRDLLPALVETLGDGDTSVVVAAAWAIGECGPDAAGAVEVLVEMSSGHREALCREAAVAALGAIGDPAGMGAVLRALNDKPAVRRRAAVALAAFDDAEADAGLRRCLEDRDWQVRQVAEDLLRP